MTEIIPAPVNPTEDAKPDSSASRNGKTGWSIALKYFLPAGLLMLGLLALPVSLGDREVLDDTPSAQFTPIPDHLDSGRSEPIHEQNRSALPEHGQRWPVFGKDDEHSRQKPDPAPDLLQQDLHVLPFRETDLPWDELNAVSNATDSSLFPEFASSTIPVLVLPFRETDLPWDELNAVSNATDESFSSGFASSTIPALLGSISMGRVDTISSMVHQVYGIVNSRHLDLVADANPHVQDLDNVPVGTAIHFPALTPRRFDNPLRGGWLSAGRFDSLEAAFQELKRMRAHHESLVLLSCYSIEAGLYFELIDLVAFYELGAARLAQEDLSQKLGIPVEVSDHWWKGALFLTELPASKFNGHQQVLDQSMKKPDKTEAVTSSPHEQASAAALHPPAAKPEKERPPAFQEGGAMSFYTLLADGFLRVYTVRKAGGERKDAGFIQVVAHVQRDLAEKEADRFLAEGWPAAVFAVEIDGRIYHRVLVGPFASAEEAQAVQEHARHRMEALKFIKQAMHDARIEQLENADGAHSIMIQVSNPQQTAELFEYFGWPLFRIKGNMLSFGPLRSAASARAYQQRALEGNGWGPLHPSNGR